MAVKAQHALGKQLPLPLAVWHKAAPLWGVAGAGGAAGARDEMRANIALNKHHARYALGATSSNHLLFKAWPRPPPTCCAQCAALAGQQRLHHCQPALLLRRGVQQAGPQVRNFNQVKQLLPHVCRGLG